MATAKQNPVDMVLASRIIEYLNELLELDRSAVAALVANRTPCNTALAGHPTCQVVRQHRGYSVGLLGVLNGLCGIDERGRGLIAAYFDEPADGPDRVGGFLDLKDFRLSEQFKGIGEPSGTQGKGKNLELEGE